MITRTAPTTKFTFDTVFAAGTDMPQKENLARQKKVLSPAEIEALRAEAYAEGLQAGEVRAANALAEAAGDAAAGLRAILQRASRDSEAMRAEAARLALSLAKALARNALEALPAAEVEAALRLSLHQALGEPRVVVRASAAVVDVLQPRLADIALEEGFEGRLQLAADPMIKGADCRIEWRGGGAERCESSLQAALTELIARRFHLTDTAGGEG